MTLEQELKNAIKQRDEVRKKVEGISRRATSAAIAKAAELTPSVDNLAGTNTRTGAMKQSWSESSVADPVWQGDKCITYLKNGMAYASYVNNGHRMKRHFVPGLRVNPCNGMLERVPREAGGIMVGTKTTYVKGLFMAEAAVEEFKRIVEEEGAKLLEDFE